MDAVLPELFAKLLEMCGKRAADDVSGVTASPADIPAPKPDTTAEQILVEPIAISNFRLRALYDTGASRTVMGAVGLQLATALGRPVMSSYGRRAKVVGGQTATIAGYVELPFEVAGVKRDIRIAVIPDDKVDCYVGENFVSAFGTIYDPINNQLIVSAAVKRVDLEGVGVSSVIRGIGNRPRRCLKRVAPGDGRARSTSMWGARVI